MRQELMTQHNHQLKSMPKHAYSIESKIWGRRKNKTVWLLRWQKGGVCRVVMYKEQNALKVTKRPRSLHGVNIYSWQEVYVLVNDEHSLEYLEGWGGGNTPCWPLCIQVKKNITLTTLFFARIRHAQLSVTHESTPRVFDSWWHFVRSAERSRTAAVYQPTEWVLCKQEDI